MATSFKLNPGITLGSGITLTPAGYSGGGGGYGTAGIDGAVGYTEINGPVTAGVQIEDPTATIDNPVGFTINDDTRTGIAFMNLSASNQTFFSTYGTGTKTVNWGSGSTVASSTVNITTNLGSQLVIFVQGQSGPATYNYPFTFN